MGGSQVQVLRVLRSEMYRSQVQDQLELHSIDQVCQSYTKLLNKQIHMKDSDRNCPGRRVTSRSRPVAVNGPCFESDSQKRTIGIRMTLIR